MKLMAISDLHANFPALNVLMQDLRAADHVICCGDIVGYNPYVNEVIDFLRELPHLHCVIGNHDDFLLRGCPDNLALHVRQWIDYANQVIRPDNLMWLGSLPMSWGGYIDDLSYYIVHGSPWRPFVDYLFADNPLLVDLGTFQYDVIAFGQTHRALIQKTTGPLLINPGSVGQSRDKLGLACAMSFDRTTMEWTKIERPY